MLNVRFPNAARIGKEFNGSIFPYRPRSPSLAPFPLVRGTRINFKHGFPSFLPSRKTGKKTKQEGILPLPNRSKSTRHPPQIEEGQIAPATLGPGGNGLHSSF